ncbi:recombination protein [Riemerella phage vB_RanS_PT33]|nr:antirepressor [Riemerella phage vB_RanS_PT03]UUJ74566.1 recombination protein [Riemerella phage vB_RanS_PT15]UVK80365.1 recombination protein [Riemerella phage vB_RanS_PT33]
MIEAKAIQKYKTKTRGKLVEHIELIERMKQQLKKIEK